MKKNIISLCVSLILGFLLTGCDENIYAWSSIKQSNTNSPIRDGESFIVTGHCARTSGRIAPDCRTFRDSFVNNNDYQVSSSCIDNGGDSLDVVLYLKPSPIESQLMVENKTIKLMCGHTGDFTEYTLTVPFARPVTIAPSSTIESMIQLEPGEQQKLTLTLPANTRSPVGSRFTILESQSYISFVNNQNSCVVNANQSSCSVTVKANSNITTPVHQTLKVVTSGYPTESVFIEIGNHGYSGKVIYVTNGSYSGVFGNSAADALINADNYCNTDTAKPFSSGNFKAILKSALRTPYNNGSWVLESNTVYYNINNESIGMTDGYKYFIFPLSHAIESIADNVWSGTDGTWSLLYNCNDWSNASTGTYGVSNAISSSSIYSTSQPCTQTAHLYCAQQ